MSAGAGSAGRFQFGVFEFNHATGELLKSGSRIALQPQSATLLGLLLNAPGELVGRDAIREALWDRDTTVDYEFGVNRCMRQLRAALNDTGRKSVYVETLAKRGYRFIAPVWILERERNKEDSLSNLPARPAPQSGSIAVLPFANLSGDGDDEYFADGLAEEIINALAQLPDLKVIARTSAFAFKGRNEDIRQIGNTLGAAMILEGSIRRFGKRVRVTTQLIRTSDAVHIFSRRYDHELVDVFALQDEIATDVASQLITSIPNPPVGMTVKAASHVSLHTKHPTANFEAYQALLEGRFHFRRFEPAALEKALTCFERCLRLDPSCAAAYTEIATYYVGMVISSAGNSRGGMAKAAEMARMAVALDPKDAAAYAILGGTAAIGDYDWATAGVFFQRARELGGQNDVRIPYALWYLTPLGRIPEAVVEIDAALMNDPLLPIVHSVKGALLIQARQYQQASECCLRALDLYPQFANALYSLVYIRSFQNQFEEAEKYALSLTATLGSLPMSLECMAFVHASAGRREEAHHLLTQMMQSSDVPGRFAMARCAVHVILGETDDAFSALQHAIDNREPQVIFLRTIPWCDPLRSDPRFGEALKQINLA